MGGWGWGGRCGGWGLGSRRGATQELDGRVVWGDERGGAETQWESGGVGCGGRVGVVVVTRAGGRGGDGQGRDRRWMGRSCSKDN